MLAAAASSQIEFGKRRPVIHKLNRSLYVSGSQVPKSKRQSGQVELDLLPHKKETETLESNPLNAVYENWEEKARKQFSNQELLAMLDSKQVSEVQCNKMGKDRLVIINS